MALIQCPECQTSVSSTANACPRCGFGILEWSRREQLRKAAQYQAARKQKNQRFYILAGGTFLFMAFMCTGISSFNRSRAATEAKEAEQAAVAVAKAADKDLAKEFVASVPDLREQVQSLSTAIAAGEWQEAERLDTEVTVALNRVGKFPQLLERDELRERLQTANTPLVAHRAQAALDAQDLDKADALILDLQKREFAGASALRSQWVEKRVSVDLTAAEAAADAKNWVGADNTVTRVLAELGTVEATDEIRNLVKRATRLQKRVSKKAAKDRKKAEDEAAEREEMTKKCGGTPGCTFVDNNTLWRAYDANEVAADNRYKGRTLVVTGRVASVDKDFTDSIVLRLQSPNQFMTTMTDVDKEQAHVAAALRKGTPIELRCKGAGMIIGSPSLRDCWILSYSP